MTAKAPLYKSLYAQVLAGIALGIVVGLVAPETGAVMRPLGDGFIKPIRMLIGPIVFTTIVVKAAAGYGATASDAHSTVAFILNRSPRPSSTRSRVVTFFRSWWSRSSPGSRC